MRSKISPTETKGKSQFALMAAKRFAPFFWTQFLGAFNDNVFRNGLMILIAYGMGNILGGKSDIMINVAAGLFILPFFIFSATAGQLADKYEKSVLIRKIKLMEIVIMGLAAVAFYFNQVAWLVLLLFLMGTQSAFFGPIKYSIIPDHLKKDEIVGGNAMVEMGTFVAILFGLIIGNLLNPTKLPPYCIGAAVCGFAVLGWLASRHIPAAAPPAPDLKINWNPFTQTIKTIGYARQVHSVFLSVLAISWFWFLGMAYLTQLPNYTLQVLKSTQDVYTFLLTIFSAGIGVGSLLCEKMSGRKVELGLVPLGAMGLSLFGIDLFFAYTPPAVENLMGIFRFLETAGSFRVLADFLMIGVFGGFYIVPLFAFVQMRTATEHRARVIAANNILNAMLMVVSTVAGALLLGVMGLSIPLFFLIIALVNIVVAAYIFTVVPEFVMRFLIWMLTHILYRIDHHHLEKIPDDGAAVVVCNHVSYVDALLLAGTCHRPIRFIMFEPIYRIPVLHFIFRVGKAIPIASRRENKAAYENAFDEISKALDDGDLVCIFPEGRLTRDGHIGEFKKGIEKIVSRNPVPVQAGSLAAWTQWGAPYPHGPAGPVGQFFQPQGRTCFFPAAPAVLVENRALRR